MATELSDAQLEKLTKSFSTPELSVNLDNISNIKIGEIKSTVGSGAALKEYDFKDISWAGLFGFDKENSFQDSWKAVFDNIGNYYSVGLMENFVSEFEKQGGKIVAKESYGTGEKDFNAIITKVKAANPDVVYLPDYYATVALIAKQLRAQGIDTPIVGADGWDGLTENAGDEVLNGYYSNHYAEDSDSPAVQKFVKNFEKKYNKKPNAFAALGYDSMYMLKDAIIAAGSTDSVKVRDALEKIDNDYVTGHIKFDAKHNPIKSAVMVKMIKAGNKLSQAYAATVEIKD